MKELLLLKNILNSFPYTICFVDNQNIIRYLNARADYHYHKERGYKNLIGKSIFFCHSNEKSRQKIKEAVEKFKKNANEIYLGLSVKNERIYMVC
jgi:DUF438 domain-containing protein